MDRGFDSFLLRGFTKILGRPVAELHGILAKARQEMFNPAHHVNVHLYAYLPPPASKLFFLIFDSHVVYGRKPALPQLDQ